MKRENTFEQRYDLRLDGEFFFRPPFFFFSSRCSLFNNIYLGILESDEEFTSQEKKIVNSNLLLFLCRQNYRQTVRWTRVSLHCISFHFFLLFYLSILFVSNSKFSKLSARRQNLLSFLFLFFFSFDRKNRKTLAKITKFICIIYVSFNFILIHSQVVFFFFVIKFLQ